MNVLFNDKFLRFCIKIKYCIVFYVIFNSKFYRIYDSLLFVYFLKTIETIVIIISFKSKEIVIYISFQDLLSFFCSYKMVLSKLTLIFL